MKPKRILTVLLISSFILVSFSGLAQDQEVSWPNDLPPQQDFPSLEGQKVTIEIWTHDPLYIEWFNQTIKEFDRLYSDIEVEGKISQIAPFQSLLDKTTAAIVSGEGLPDIIGSGNHTMGRIWEKGLYEAFMPLPLREEGLYEEFYEPILTPAKRPGSTEVYGLPTDVPVTVLWYREDILEEAGCEPPIETWDEYVECGKKVTKDLDGDGSTDRWMTVMTKNVSSPDVVPYQYHPIRRQLGSQFFTEEGEIVIASEENAKAAQFISDLVNKWEIAKPVANAFGGNSGQALFKEGKAATYLSATWYLDFLMKAYYPDQAGKWRAQAHPKFEKGGLVDIEGIGSRTGKIGGTYMMILKSEKQDFVWEFLKYSYASSENLIRYWEKIHYLPTTKKALDSEEVTGFRSEYLGGQKLGELYSELVPELQPEYTHIGLTPLKQSLMDHTPKLIDGRLTGQEWVKLLEEEVKSMIE